MPNPLSHVLDSLRTAEIRRGIHHKPQRLGAKAQARVRPKGEAGRAHVDRPVAQRDTHVKQPVGLSVLQRVAQPRRDILGPSKYHGFKVPWNKNRTTSISSLSLSSPSLPLSLSPSLLQPVTHHDTWRHSWCLINGSIGAYVSDASASSSSRILLWRLRTCFFAYLTRALIRRLYAGSCPVLACDLASCICTHALRNCVRQDACHVTLQC